MIRFLLCSFTFVLLYPTAIDLYLVGLPTIAADLKASTAELHTAFSVYLLGVASTLLLAGKVADGLGRKPVALIGASIYCLAAVVAADATTVQFFLWARFFQGIGAGACYVVAFAILRDVLDDKRRAKVLSMINGVICVVPVMAPVIGHWIMLSYPWQSLFYTMAGMGGVVVLIATFLFIETKPVNVSAITKANPQASERERFLTFYFIRYLMVTSLGVASILAFVNTSPMILMGDLGLERGEYSSVMVYTALVGMLTSFLTPFALNFVKVRHLILTAQCLFGLAGGSLWWAGAWQLPILYYVAALTLLCIAFSLGFGVAMSQALSPYAQRAAMASSLLCIAQVSFSAGYIGLMGQLGFSALTILVGILVVGCVISMSLLLFKPQKMTLFSLG